MCDQTTNTTSQIKAGRGQGVCDHQRRSATRRCRTCRRRPKAGLPDVEVGVWHGLYVPAETPDEIVQALTEALQAALEGPERVAEFAELGTTPVPRTGHARGAHRAPAVADRAVEADHRGGRRDRR